MKRQRKRKNTLIKNRNIIFPILLVLGGFLLLFNDLGIMRWYQLKKERDKIQAEIEHLISQESLLTNKIDQLKNDDEFIKKIAQERFQMVKPGEKVFRVINSQL